MDTPSDSRLETWSRFQAVGMLGSAGVACAVRDTRVLFIFALFSFFGLVTVSRGNWSKTREFGWGNAVTSLRLALVLLIALGLEQAPNRWWGILSFAIFVLDGIDGWLARVTRSDSSFGAHFDMEVDAFFVAVLTQALWQRSVLGTWVLVPGLLRYLYVLFNAVIDADAPEMPRSWFGRIAFSSLALGLTGAFLLPASWGALTAWCGTCLVGLSFARGFLWTWTHRGIVKSRQLTQTR